MVLVQIGLRNDYWSTSWVVVYLPVFDRTGAKWLLTRRGVNSIWTSLVPILAAKLHLWMGMGSIQLSNKVCGKVSMLLLRCRICLFLFSTFHPFRILLAQTLPGSSQVQSPCSVWLSPWVNSNWSVGVLVVFMSRRCLVFWMVCQFSYEKIGASNTSILPPPWKMHFLIFLLEWDSIFFFSLCSWDLGWKYQEHLLSV